jgi:hypothetical protein
VVSIPACHAGDRGSIPRHGEFFICLKLFLEIAFYNTETLNLLKKVAEFRPFIKLRLTETQLKKFRFLNAT